jgi:hypothetical protein
MLSFLAAMLMAVTAQPAPVNIDDVPPDRDSVTDRDRAAEESISSHS